MTFSMNKKIAGMSVGAIVILAVVAFVVYWFSFRTEGFDGSSTVQFEITNLGKDDLYAQIQGFENGTTGTSPTFGKNPTVTISPGRTETAWGFYTASDKVPFTLKIEYVGKKNNYHVEIQNAKPRTITGLLYSELFIRGGPLNQLIPFRTSLNTNTPLPEPIVSTKNSNLFINYGKKLIFKDNRNIEGNKKFGRRIFIEKL